MSNSVHLYDVTGKYLFLLKINDSCWLLLICYICYAKKFKNNIFIQ